MRIGELSSAASTPVETIRYYEREGLLPAPARTGGNFRAYDAPHLERLQFVRFCRGLDMSLDEIRALLAVRDDPAAGCGDVNALLDAHIGHVATRIRELQHLEAQLRDLRARCPDAPGSERCGILAGLAEAAQEPAAPAPEARHLRAVHGR